MRMRASKAFAILNSGTTRSVGRKEFNRVRTSFPGLDNLGWGKRTGHDQLVITPADLNHLAAGTRRNDEIVLQRVLFRAIVDQVDAGVDLGVAHLGIVADALLPLRGIVADEIRRVSVGAITHSAPASDLSLEVAGTPQPVFD